MTAKEVFAAKPYGATVTFSDGTKRPPERFNKKLQDWERRNGAGLFVRADEPRPYSTGGFGLQLSDGDVLVVTKGFCMESPLDFVVTPPQPGTIMTYSEFEGRIEVKHVYPNIEAARAWCARKRYDLFDHGYKVWIVADDGSLKDFTREGAAV